MSGSTPSLASSTARGGAYAPDLRLVADANPVRRITGFPLLGEAAVLTHLVTESQLEMALVQQRRTYARLGDLLVNHFGVERASIESIAVKQEPYRRLEWVLGKYDIKPHHIQQVLDRVNSRTESLDDVMRDTGLLSEEGVARVNAILLGLPYVAPNVAESIDIAALSELKLSPTEGAEFVPIARILPVSAAADARGTLIVAVAGANARAQAHNELREFGQMRFVFASRSTVQGIYRRFFANVGVALRRLLSDAERSLRRSSGSDLSDPTLVRRALLTCLRYACYDGASDLHFQTTLLMGRIAIRVDGVMRTVATVSRALLEAMHNLLATDAKLRAEQLDNRLADGSVTFKNDDEMQSAFADLFRRYSFRLEIGGSVQGGRTAVIRVLDSESTATEFDAIGFEPADRQTILNHVRSPEGLILVVGPTGSGKTTTQYAMLEQIDSQELDVQTIENPVERRYGAWKQYDVSKAEGVSEEDAFDEHFRHVLRNDPDVVMVGEVRSSEVAALVIRAAQTGQLVFSTVHVNRAHHVIGRFRSLGIEPVYLTDYLSLVIGQRLARKLCRHCAVPDEREQTHAELLGAQPWLQSLGLPLRPHRAQDGGCPNCGFQGYRGRIAVYELMEVTPAVRGLVESGVNSSDLERALYAPGRSMWDCGLKLLARGVISYESLSAAVKRDAPIKAP